MGILIVITNGGMVFERLGMRKCLWPRVADSGLIPRKAIGRGEVSVSPLEKPR